ncbi:MAG: hypothetical protein WA705_23805 [Candidatus Ozemobacteraceae bacterium]
MSDNEVSSANSGNPGNPQNSPSSQDDPNPHDQNPETPDSSTESSSSPSPFRRLFGALLWLFAIALFLGSAGIYFVYTRFLNPVAMKAQFEEQVGRAVGLSVRVGAIELDFPTVKLAEVSIGSEAVDPDQPRVTAGGVTVTPDFWELIGGRILFDHLALSSATVHLVRRVDGTFDLGPLGASASPAQGAPAPSFELPFRDVTLNGVSLEIDDRARGRPVRAVLDHLTLSRALFGSGMPLEGTASFDDTAHLSIKGSFQPPSGCDVDVAIDKVDMKRVSVWLPANVHIPAELQTPTLKAHILFSVERGLQVSGAEISSPGGFTLNGGADLTSLSPVSGQASFTLLPVQSERLIELAGPFLPPTAHGIAAKGKVSGGAHLILKNGALAGYEAWMKPDGLHVTASALPMPLEGISGSVTYAEGAVGWKNLGITLGGQKIVSESGHVDPTTLRGTTQLSLDLDAASAFKSFRKYLPKTALHADPSGKVTFQGRVTIAGVESGVNGTVSASGLQFTPLAGGFPVEIEKTRITLNDTTMSSGKISIAEFSGQFLGIPLQVSGDVTNGLDPEFAVQFRSSIDLAQVRKNLPIGNDPISKSFQISGNAAMEGRLGGSLKKPKPDATVTLKGVSISQKETGFSLTDLSASARADEKSVTLHDANAQFVGGKLALDGSVRDFAKPMVVATGTLTGVDLKEVRTLLSKVFPTFPAGLETLGKADIDLSVTGAAGTPNLSGSAVLSNAVIKHPSLMRPLSSIIGPVRFTNKGLSTEGLQAAWGSSTVRVVGRIDDFGKFLLNLSYQIQPLDMTDIGGFFLTGTGYQAYGSGQGAGKVTGSMEKMVLDGTAQLPQGRFEAPISKTNPATFKFPFTDLNAPFRLASGVLDVQNAKAKLFDGTVQTTGKIFLLEKPIRFSFDTTGTSISTEQFLSTNTKMKNVVTGNVNLSLRTGGNTTGLESLDGGLDLGMKNGTYQAPPVAAQLFSMLQADKLSSGTLSALAGKFVFKNGKMNSNDLIFKSPFGQLGYKGSVGLDTSLSGTLNVQITNAACQSSSILRQLVGNRPALDLPVGVKGSLFAPAIDLNVQSLLKEAGKQMLEDMARKEATKALSGLLGGGKNASAQQNASGTAPVTTQPKNAQEAIFQELGNILLKKPRQSPAPEPVTPPVATPHPLSQPVIPAAPAQAPAAPAAVVPTPTPVPQQSPDKQLKNELKNIEKDLKNIFKF